MSRINLPPRERPKPDILPHIQKKNHSFKNDEIYKPSDMSTLEDHEIFFKYCPDKRIKCYHAIAASTGARPHEILKLKISDIDWAQSIYRQCPSFDYVVLLQRVLVNDFVFLALIRVSRLCTSNVPLTPRNRSGSTTQSQGAVFG